MPTTFEVGTTYSFDTLAPGILGASFKNVRLLGKNRYEVARVFGRIDQMHRQVYPELPPGIPDDPKEYLYLLFIDSQGAKILLGEPWIDASSVVTSGALTLTITVPNANSQDITTISRSLTLMGYQGFSVTSS
jgi:hypothetical protein